MRVNGESGSSTFRTRPPSDLLSRVQGDPCDPLKALHRLRVPSQRLRRESTEHQP
jgi:hypothetical protein